MSKTRQLTQGAATFFIFDKELEHKDDDPFILWLKSEGFKAEYFGHGNADHAIYVNINTKVYTWAMAGVGLSPIVGNHAIHIDEFMQIYKIFDRYSGFNLSIYSEEEQRKYDENQARIALMEEQAKRAREEYFAQNPDYEQWFDDIIERLLEIERGKEHKSDYTKEDILRDHIDNWIEQVLRIRFADRYTPDQVAKNWDYITYLAWW